MIKKITAVFMSAFYLLISIGFSVSVHHCSGTNKVIVEVLEKNTCCCKMESSDCCSSEEKVVQWDDDQQLISSFLFQYQLEASSFESCIVIIEETDSDKTIDLFIEDPPPNLQKAFILFHQMTFYG